MTTAVAEPPLDTAQQEDVPAEESQVVAPHVQSMKPQGITDETWQSLTTKAKLYVAEYVQHGNTLKAYRNAGYARGKQEADLERHKAAAYQIRKGKHVRQALVEHADHRADLAQAKKDYALDWIVSEHERLMGLAEVKGDLAVATRNLELIGRTRGAYADVVVGDVVARREYSEAEEIEGRRLARLLLDAPDEVEVEVVEDQKRGPAPRVRGKDGKYVGGTTDPRLSRPNSHDSQNGAESQGEEPKNPVGEVPEGARNWTLGAPRQA